ncbi:nucleotidyltransferase domain-containing protein [Microseira wollei]|uniref:cGAS/DncV-like nucleotidyltransferase C-terminal helical domain-containing protein n=1 Tax=Microseira wollei NIES-4236 TaxID=2530354 RepID=A0AAV3XE01_9CYAN|nr:nucleotidyltransferase [Microseira wollei]GET38906.1 hypothetical protein MiSe_36660 [Microseira wollei NIES-4236]
MPISESQLQTWSNQGAVVSAKLTHESIRNALAAYNWSSGITYDTYLQGSYRNSTNIRGDSDVDLVVELTSVFYSNLSEREKSKLGITPAAYGWSEFRQEVINALSSYYGSQYVDKSGSKSIKLLPNSGRLKADVVVAVKYKHYENMRLVAEGMTFWTLSGSHQIYNFPKLHYENGTNKNSQQQTKGLYKPNVRVFKNARNRIIETNTLLSGRFPSYFIECLLFNVPNSKFSTSYQSTFVNSINWLNTQLYNDGWQGFLCQNKMNYLFGNSTVQWNVIDAREYVSRLVAMWNN